MRVPGSKLPGPGEEGEFSPAGTLWAGEDELLGCLDLDKAVQILGRAEALGVCAGEPWWEPGEVESVYRFWWRQITDEDDFYTTDIIAWPAPAALHTAEVDAHVMPTSRSSCTPPAGRPDHGVRPVLPERPRGRL